MLHALSLLYAFLRMDESQPGLSVLEQYRIIVPVVLVRRTLDIPLMLIYLERSRFTPLSAYLTPYFSKSVIEAVSSHMNCIRALHISLT
jgi:hypothetical protein